MEVVVEVEEVAVEAVAADVGLRIGLEERGEEVVRWLKGKMGR